MNREEELNATLEAVQGVRETWAGVLNGLQIDGYTQREAAAIAVATAQQLAALAWAEAAQVAPIPLGGESLG